MEEIKKNECLYNKFSLHYKNSLSDSTAGRTSDSKEKFCRVDEAYVQEYDMDQVPLSSEISVEHKIFVSAFFCSVFSGVEH